LDEIEVETSDNSRQITPFRSQRWMHGAGRFLQAPKALDKKIDLFKATQKDFIKHSKGQRENHVWMNQKQLWK